MCSLCGFVGQGPSWEQEGRSGDDGRWRLGREARETAAELTRLLSPQQIRITASPSFGFIVRFPTGRTDLVQGLSPIWHLLDQRKVAIPDPLSG